MKNDTANLILLKTITKIEGAYSHATIRAYKADFLKFIDFCVLRNENALPASSDSVAQFIIKLVNDGLCSASIRRAVAGISAIHRLNRMIDPTKDPDVNIEMRRMHRKLGRLSKQAYGVSKTDLKKMIKSQDNSLHGLRNKALLLTAFNTLCRRSELTQLLVSDLTIYENGEGIILLRRSKVDQEAKGNLLTLDKTTIQSIKEWLCVGKIKEGYLFRGVDKASNINNKLSAGQINRIFKKVAEKSNLDSRLVTNISGHSLRVGAAKELAKEGNGFPILMSKGRWTKIDTVMKYIQN